MLDQYRAVTDAIASLLIGVWSAGNVRVCCLMGAARTFADGHSVDAARSRSHAFKGTNQETGEHRQYKQYPAHWLDFICGGCRSQSQVATTHQPSPLPNNEVLQLLRGGFPFSVIGLFDNRVEPDRDGVRRFFFDVMPSNRRSQSSNRDLLQDVTAMKRPSAVLKTFLSVFSCGDVNHIQIIQANTSSVAT